jgi:hypothetical protein
VAHIDSHMAQPQPHPAAWCLVWLLGLSIAHLSFIYLGRFRVLGSPPGPLPRRLN